MPRLRVRRSIVAVRSARVAECGARASSRYLRSSRMMLGGGGGVRMSCGLRPVGLLRSCGLARVRSCGFDGLTFGACPTVPGCAVFERGGALRGVLPGSASGLPLGWPATSRGWRRTGRWWKDAGGRGAAGAACPRAARAARAAGAALRQRTHPQRQRRERGGGGGTRGGLHESCAPRGIKRTDTPLVPRGFARDMAEAEREAPFPGGKGASFQ